MLGPKDPLRCDERGGNYSLLFGGTSCEIEADGLILWMVDAKWYVVI